MPITRNLSNKENSQAEEEEIRKKRKPFGDTTNCPMNRGKTKKGAVKTSSNSTPQKAQNGAKSFKGKSPVKLVKTTTKSLHTPKKGVDPNGSNNNEETGNKEANKLNSPFDGNKNKKALNVANKKTKEIKQKRQQDVEENSSIDSEKSQSGTAAKTRKSKEAKQPANDSGNQTRNGKKGAKAKQEKVKVNSSTDAAKSKSVARGRPRKSKETIQQTMHSGNESTNGKKESGVEAKLEELNDAEKSESITTRKNSKSKEAIQPTNVSGKQTNGKIDPEAEKSKCITTKKTTKSNKTTQATKVLNNQPNGQKKSAAEVEKINRKLDEAKQANKASCDEQTSTGIKAKYVKISKKINKKPSNTKQTTNTASGDETGVALDRANIEKSNKIQQKTETLNNIVKLNDKTGKKQATNTENIKSTRTRNYVNYAELTVVEAKNSTNLDNNKKVPIYKKPLNSLEEKHSDEYEFDSDSEMPTKKRKKRRAPGDSTIFEKKMQKVLTKQLKKQPKKEDSYNKKMEKVIGKLKHKLAKKVTSVDITTGETSINEAVCEDYLPNNGPYDKKPAPIYSAKLAKKVATVDIKTGETSINVAVPEESLPNNDPYDENPVPICSAQLPKSVRTEDIENEETTIDEALPEDIFANNDSPLPIFSENAFNVDNSFGFDKLSPIKVHENICIIPDTNMASSPNVYRRNPTANSTMLPWRPDVKIKRNPYFVRIKPSVLPALHQDIIMDHTYDSEPSRHFTTATREGKQTSILDFIPNSDKSLLDEPVQTQSFFDNDQFSPVKNKQASTPRKVLGVCTNILNTISTPNQEVEALRISNYFGFDESTKEIKENQDPLQMPFRSVFAQVKKYQRKDNSIVPPIVEAVDEEDPTVMDYNASFVVPRLFEDFENDLTVKERKRTKRKAANQSNDEKPSKKRSKEDEELNKWAASVNKEFARIDEAPLEIE